MNLIKPEDPKVTAELTPEEAQLLKNYRCLHDEARWYAREYMKNYATHCPRKEPALRIVKGGAA